MYWFATGFEVGRQVDHRRVEDAGFDQLEDGERPPDATVAVRERMQCLASSAAAAAAWEADGGTEPAGTGIRQARAASSGVDDDSEVSESHEPEGL